MTVCMICHFLAEVDDVVVASASGRCVCLCCDR